jgi:hypothetical protein
MKKAQQARDKLVARYLDHPDVTLIDIGLAPATEAEKRQGIALRIHVRQRWMSSPPDERVAFPDEIDGVRVVVLAGDYKPEDDS